MIKKLFAWRPTLSAESEILNGSKLQESLQDNLIGMSTCTAKQLRTRVGIDRRAQLEQSVVQR